MFDGKEYVYAVYEEKSFSKAAQKLYITQPALSTAIKKVEKKIGTPIFDRSTSPIGLTPGGSDRVCWSGLQTGSFDGRGDGRSRI